MTIPTPSSEVCARCAIKDAEIERLRAFVDRVAKTLGHRSDFHHKEPNPNCLTCQARALTESSTERRE